MSYKLVLMLYFPGMLDSKTPATPDYNSDSEENNFSVDKDQHEYYTPFLVEMIPSKFTVNLF